MREQDNQKIYGILKPSNDAHTLGVSNVEELIKSCGYRVSIAPERVSGCAPRLSDPECRQALLGWLREEGITDLGFSYRLDPDDAVNMFGRLYALLQEAGSFRGANRIRNLFFAALPPAAQKISQLYKGKVECFYGDETPIETADKLGIPVERLAQETAAGAEYDESRLTFARELIKSASYESTPPPDRSGYPTFGTDRDSVVERVDYARSRKQPPLIRAHVGPYMPNRIEALHTYLDWAKQLAEAGYLDVLSIGTSQLSQERFGQDWGDMPNGGGVPINSEEEFRAVWDAARPMLVRTYAGTADIPKLASVYEKTINIAWHALSFWWFCAIDGRGPLSLHDNLAEHFQTSSYIASTGKPLEPNVPHHFAFRGADDATYVTAGILAVRAAAKMGVKTIVLQSMLNTPKATWGVNDLAKARVLLEFARQIPGVRVLLQPRAGLDYFSHDLNKAKVQLAAVTAMMDDIEPENTLSPDIIHVVSYSEAVRLADPDVVNESIRITLAALSNYREQKMRGNVYDISDSQELQERVDQLRSEVSQVLESIERTIGNPYTPEGFYKIFKAGYLPVPYLWLGTEEFPRAIGWKTGMLRGGVCVVDENGKAVPVNKRLAATEQYARAASSE